MGMDNKQEELTEHIDHQTKSRPFSMHHINIPAGMELALYLHCHREMELYYLESGDVIFYIEELSFGLHAGDAVFIPPNLLHSAMRSGALDSQCSFYAFVFSQDMLMDIMPSYCEHYLHPVMYNTLSCAQPLYSDIEWQNQILFNLRNIFGSYGEEVDTCELMLRGNLLIIWQLLYNNHLALILNDNSAEDSIQIRNSMDYIADNYMENLSLSELARQAGLSEGHFCRQFKAYTGLTPFSYLNRKRISKSCEYLTRTNKKITEIAALCGYNNISYFNRAFAGIIKESPSSYRKHYPF